MGHSAPQPNGVVKQTSSTQLLFEMLLDTRTLDMLCDSQHSLRGTKRIINPLTPNDHYSGRTAPLTCKCCILYIYSTNTDTEYFKHGIYSPFISLQNAVCFVILTYLVPVLFAFYIQEVLKFKKNNSG